MSSPSRKKRADSGSALTSPARVDAESGLLVTATRGEFRNAVHLLPLTHAVQKEENAPGDEDSAVLDNASSTASLTSSILQYRTINGRAYQSERGNPEYWCVMAVKRGYHD